MLPPISFTPPWKVRETISTKLSLDVFVEFEGVEFLERANIKEITFTFF